MRALLALTGLAISFQAHAFFTAKSEKPDPYARRHYTAADLPAAKRAKKMKSKVPSDAEIAAEIARESAGANPAPVAPKAKKPAAAVASAEHASVNADPIVRKPAVVNHSAAVAVCKIPPKPSTEQRFLISDSDGFAACNEHGGQVTAGRDEDRSLTNVKDADKSSKQ